MSMFLDYIKEREGKEVLEDDNGFAVYSFYNDVVYLSEIYIKKEHRKSGLARRMADEVTLRAREHGCKKMLGSVDISTNGVNFSILMMIGYGMKPSSLNGNMIYFEKEI